MQQLPKIIGDCAKQRLHPPKTLQSAASFFLKNSDPLLTITFLRSII